MVNILYAVERLRRVGRLVYSSCKSLLGLRTCHGDGCGPRRFSWMLEGTWVQKFRVVLVASSSSGVVLETTEQRRDRKDPSSAVKQCYVLVNFRPSHADLIRTNAALI